MGAHLIDGEFQSDKYPTTPRGKVPLSCVDPTAQDLLWAYAQRRRAVDPGFSGDLEAALRAAGFSPERAYFTAPPTDTDWELIARSALAQLSDMLGSLAPRVRLPGEPFVSASETARRLLQVLDEADRAAKEPRDAAGNERDRCVAAICYRCAAGGRPKYEEKDGVWMHRDEPDYVDESCDAGEIWSLHT